VEGAFRAFRDLLGVKTVLTAAQFLEQGFAERKVLLLIDAIQACKRAHNDEVRKERQASARAGAATGGRGGSPGPAAGDLAAALVAAATSAPGS